MTTHKYTLTDLGTTLVSHDPIDLLTYQRDCSVVPPGHARSVVLPTDSETVSTVLQQANRERVPVYVRGGGTMYAGAVNPHAGGIVLDMSEMDRILDVDLQRGLVICEPGVRFGELLKALQVHGVTIGIVPSTAPTATIGGATSAHALGTGSAKFQSFADEVAGLEVVLADGRRIRTGSAAAKAAGFFHRYAIGPDLTGLFLGADATMGVVTAIALWLHRLPEYRVTACFGFDSVAAGADFLMEIQRRELTRNIWYASGYEAGTIRARIGQALPEIDAASLPQFGVGVDFGGERELVERDLRTISEIAAGVGGGLFPDLNDIYFRKLRHDEIFWYSFAGYFVRSRCAILMSSLPTERLPEFIETVARQRVQRPEFIWGGAVVVCRRGLHGAVMAFYDEATQWEAAQTATADCARDLVAIGAVPYKTGKLWAAEVRQFSEYHGLLQQLKTALDPHGILSPGNLGL